MRRKSTGKTRYWILFTMLLILIGIFIFTFLTQHNSANNFTDEFNQFNPERWQISGPWSNGAAFLNSWRQDHLAFSNGILQIRLDDMPCATDPAQCAGQPYASAEYSSNDLYPYGCLESRFKAVQENGVVTSLFFYSDELSDATHDEIDIEILGNDPTKMQTNYYANGFSHPQTIDLGFNSADDFHTYAIEWTTGGISWYVDGKLLHTEDGSNGTLPTHAGYIMLNAWPVDESASEWAGEFIYPGTPIYAEYDWIRYSPSRCSTFHK